jgi:hypothetical protein
MPRTWSTYTARLHRAGRCRGRPAAASCDPRSARKIVARLRPVTSTASFNVYAIISPVAAKARAPGRMSVSPSWRPIRARSGTCCPPSRSRQKPMVSSYTQPSRGQSLAACRPYRPIRASVLIARLPAPSAARPGVYVTRRCPLRRHRTGPAQPTLPVLFRTPPAGPAARSCHKGGKNHRRFDAAV